MTKSVTETRKDENTDGTLDIGDYVNSILDKLGSRVAKEDNVEERENSEVKQFLGLEELRSIL